jgi:uncharacterized repeat protein (TIGR01451 family)
MNRHISLTAAVLTLALSAWGASARAQGATAGDIEFRNVAEIEQEVKTADGKVERKRMPVQKAIPGTEVFYTSTFRNTGKKPAANIAVVNPVPANTTLVGGSAFGENTQIAFSADGGKTWAAADQLKVTGKDGKARPAALSEFTHIRWTYRGELAPGKQSSVGFRVVVN